MARAPHEVACRVGCVGASSFPFYFCPRVLNRVDELKYRQYVSDVGQRCDVVFSWPARLPFCALWKSVPACVLELPNTGTTVAVFVIDACFECARMRLRII